MLPALTQSPYDVMSDRQWSSNALGRSWNSIESENLSGSFSLSLKRTAKLRGDRLSSSLGNSDWARLKQEKNATALSEAVKKGRLRHIQLLLEAGTDPNIADESGVPALVTAVLLPADHSCQERVIKLLLKNSADPNLGDSRGTTPLMHAARADRHDAAVNLLQHGRGLDPGIQDIDGNSALMYAAAFGRTEIALLILSTFKKLHHLTFINNRNSQGLTATQLAEQNGHESLALLLKVENEFAPRPSGPSTFIPSSCDLDRPPTPTETSDIGSLPESNSVEPKKPVQNKSFKLGPPSLEEQKVLDHLSKSLDLSSSPGSGNEADTESLMEAEKLTVEDLDNHTGTEMAAPTASVLSYNVHPAGSGVVHREALSEPMQQRRLSGSLGSVNTHNSSSLHLLESGNLKNASLSSSAAALLSTEGMPKINKMHALNKNIKGLVQEDIELRPGQRPPTPARPSLPTLLPNRLQDGTLISTSNNKLDGIRNPPQMRRITLTSIPRSSSEPHQIPFSPRVPSSDDETLDILESSIKSEGWDQMRVGRMSRAQSQMQCSDGHVVPLPPICQSRYVDIVGSKSTKVPENIYHKEDNVLNVAKKTLEKLDDVLSPDSVPGRIQRTRTQNQLHLTS